MQQGISAQPRREFVLIPTFLGGIDISAAPWREIKVRRHPVPVEQQSSPGFLHGEKAGNDLLRSAHR